MTSLEKRRLPQQKELLLPREEGYLDFFEMVGKSKRLPRTGWVREGVQDPESVAEHSFRVGVLAMVLTHELGYDLDQHKLMTMALLHDLGEVITGDIVVERRDVIDIKKRDEKEQEEREGIREIFGKIGKGNEYVAIFDEMIGRVTPEAKIFWQLDKLEMALQAYDYEKEQGKDLEEFFLSVGLHHVREPFLKKIFDTLVKRRPKKRKKP